VPHTLVNFRVDPLFFWKKFSPPHAGIFVIRLLFPSRSEESFFELFGGSGTYPRGFRVLVGLPVEIILPAPILPPQAPVTGLRHSGLLFKFRVSSPLPPSNESCYVHTALDRLNLFCLSFLDKPILQSNPCPWHLCFPSLSPLTPPTRVSNPIRGGEV